MFGVLGLYIGKFTKIGTHSLDMQDEVTSDFLAKYKNGKYRWLKTTGVALVQSVYILH